MYKSPTIFTILTVLLVSNPTIAVKINFVDSGQKLGTANTKQVMFVDIDGDEDPDLVEGNCYNLTWTTRTRIYRNTNGQFIDTGQELSMADCCVRALEAGDVDKDGDLDIIFGSDGQWVLYFNDGDGNFIVAEVDIGGKTYSLGLADLHNVGYLDMVQGTQYVNELSKADRIYLNDNGAFLPPEWMIGLWKTSTSDITTGIDFIDFNYDARTDIVASCTGPDRIYYYWEPDGFSEENCILIEGDDRPGEVKVGDINDDGHLDIVSSDGIFLNNGDMTTVTFLASTGGYNVDLADFDRDGDLDLLNDQYLYINNGSGEFTLSFTFPNAPQCTDVNDIDGDGDLDCVFGFSEGRPTEIWLNTTPKCTQRPAMDFNDDCKVDFRDLAIFTNSWLECNIEPPEACWD